MDNKSYRSIVKGTAVFGGSQIIQILVNILRGKMISILIGSIGMGINALYNSSMMMLITVSGMGMKTSYIRDIAEVADRGDEMQIARKIAILNKCFIVLCLFGIIVTICFSPILSKYSFGDLSYSVNYCLLSLYLVFTLLGDNCTAILQGLHRIKDTALSTVVSSVLALIISSLLFFFWGLNGIVANIIITSFVILISKYFFVRRLKYPSTRVSYKEAFAESRGAFTFGFAMVISTLIGNVVTFLINAFISNRGQIQDVGLFQAGLSLTTQSVALVFASMAADYYPKLVVACKNKFQMSKLVNEQGEIICLLALPSLFLLMLFCPIIIKLLFTAEFLVATNLIRLLSVGVMIQSISYSLGYISFARGDKKTFFILEGLWSNIFRLAAYVLGYYLGGLSGLGIAFILSYLIYLILIIAVTKTKYDYNLNSNYLRIIIISLSVMIGSCTIIYFTGYIWPFYIAAIPVVGCSIYGLNNRIGLINYIKSKIYK